MTSSSGLFSDPDNARVELPVFLSPPELLFTPTKRRSSLTVFNPYQSEVQFRILTTSPERYDVGITKGTIKSGRRIDITVRLLSSAIPDLPDPSEIPQAIDYFRFSVQFGQLKGNRSVEVHWSSSADQPAGDEGISANDEELSARFRTKSSKLIPSTQSNRQTSTSPLINLSARPANTHPSSIRPARQSNQLDGSSNVNLGKSSCLTIPASFCISGECKYSKLTLRHVYSLHFMHRYLRDYTIPSIVHRFKPV